MIPLQLQRAGSVIYVQYIYTYLTYTNLHLRTTLESCPVSSTSDRPDQIISSPPASAVAERDHHPSHWEISLGAHRIALPLPTNDHYHYHTITITGIRHCHSSSSFPSFPRFRVLSHYYYILNSTSTSTSTVSKLTLLPPSKLPLQTVLQSASSTGASPPSPSMRGARP